MKRQIHKWNNKIKYNTIKNKVLQVYLKIMI